MEKKSSHPFEIFFCYADNDSALRDELDKHLAGLGRSHSATVWHNGVISPGYPRRQEIEAHLRSAHIILLLVSSDFIHSDFCYTQEMEQAIKRHQAKEARVIPVLLRPCDYSDTPFSSLQMLPSNTRPVTSWFNRDEAFEAVAKGIRKVVEELRIQHEQWASEKPRREPEKVVLATSPDRPSTSPRNQRLPRPNRWKWLSLFLCAMLLFGLVAGIREWAIAHNPPPPPHPLPPIRTWTAPDGELIGLSYGSSAFDTDLDDSSYKKEAAQKFAAGDITAAKSLWQQAIDKDTGDAEELIYQEDQRVRASRKSYITLVVATILTGGVNARVGLDDLQGAYVAQKEFNSSAPPNNFDVRLLIANSGSGDNESQAGKVAEQIVQAASSDSTIVGVMGWPFSQSTVNAVNVLSSAHIPMVSETASADRLTNVSKYFFRIIPPDFQQGMENANYVAQTLHGKRAALFVDPNNAYSSNFANDFGIPYQEHGNSIVATEDYTVGGGKANQWSSLLNDALSQNPDVIYFAGYADDLNAMLGALSSQGLGATIPIVGGEGLYELGGYNKTARAHSGQLHFLAYAYPDEWTQARLPNPPFFNEYRTDFNPFGKVPLGKYGFTRADNDVIVSYDATRTLLTASEHVLGDGEATSEDITRENLQQSLVQIKNHPLQGVSGQIAFDSGGNPLDKPILLIHVDPGDLFHEDRILSGCLQVCS